MENSAGEQQTKLQRLYRIDPDRVRNLSIVTRGRIYLDWAIIIGSLGKFLGQTNLQYESDILSLIVNN